MVRQAISPHSRKTGRKMRQLSPRAVPSRVYPMPASVFQATTYGEDPLVSQNDIEVDSTLGPQTNISLRSIKAAESREDLPCSKAWDDFPCS